MKKLFLGALVLSALMVTSCKEDDKAIDEVTNSLECDTFVAGDALASIYVGEGEFQLVDMNNDQITYTEDHSVYMVADYDFTKSYTLNIDGALTLESFVTVAYTSVGFESLEESAIAEMQVVKVDNSGEVVWLWDDAKSIGFIMLFEPLEEL